MTRVIKFFLGFAVFEMVEDKMRVLGQLSKPDDVLAFFSTYVFVYRELLVTLVDIVGIEADGTFPENSTVVFQM